MINTKESKANAIKVAYGEHWQTVEMEVDENGWFSSGTTDRQVFEHQLRSIGIDASMIDQKGVLDPVTWNKTKFMRPKSLRGIEDNNGWTKIETNASNLPNEMGDFFGLFPDGTISCFWFNPDDNFDIDLFTNELTHYQPIIKPQPPIY